MIKIKGYVTKNAGAETTNVGGQLPLIAKEFPEVEPCHKGTINLLLTKPLIVLKPDYQTAPIQWLGRNSAGEVFDLLRVELEITRVSKKIQAWLFIPHWSPNRVKPWLHEVIAPYCEGIQAGDECIIHIKREYVSLDFDNANTVYIV